MFAKLLAWAFRSHEDRIMSAVSQMLADRETPIAYEGTVMPGSFNPKNGTVEVLIGDTYGVFGDDGDTLATLKNVPLLTPMVGDLSAPIGGANGMGGERVILHRDFGAMLHHGNDDSPGSATGILPAVQPGERIQAHRNPATLEWDSFRHVTNDGPTTGDGLGGVVEQSGALHKTGTTGQLLHELNDTTGQITHVAGAVSQTLDKTANKLTHAALGVTTIYDGNGYALSHIAGKIGVGSLVSDLEAENAAMHNGHITTFASNIMSQMLQSFATEYSAAMETAGIPSAAAFAAIVKVAGWVTGNITPPTVPSGSSVVRIVS